MGEFFLRARVAYGMQCVMEFLKVVPSAEEQQEACQLMWDSLKNVPFEYIIAYCQMVAENLEGNKFGVMGNA